MARHFAVFESIRPTPDGEHELGHELFWSVASIAMRLWQTTTGKCLLKAQMIKHLFHQRHPTPSGDFFIGKSKLKTHNFNLTEIAITYSNENSP